MCGIVGYFRFRGDFDAGLPRVVEAARDVLTQRGPDDAGLYVSPDGLCVLGHRRLSIVDLSVHGHQPMTNEDGTLWIVLNGEIYNHEDLREELIRKGHPFRSHSDTEVILHLFEEEGTRLVDRLDGEFAFVIYDVNRRRLYGARDRLGVKPLYYALSASRFAFGSEPKALLALPDVSREPRPEEIPGYLAFNCVAGPATLHRDIEKLEPGTLFEVAGDGTLRRERFWLPAAEPVGDADDSSTLVALLDHCLRRAVKNRMMSDVPFGAMLSGGVDSSLTVALMSETLGASVKTFTIGYPGDEANKKSDLCYARLVAHRFATDHHEVILTDAEIAETLTELPALADDPIGAPSVTANLQLARFARRSGITVAQVGEGGDEVFCGYDTTHRLWRLHDRLGALSYLIPRSAAGWLERLTGPALERLGNPSLVGSLDGTLLDQMRRYARGEHLYWGYGGLWGEQARLLARQASTADPYRHLSSRMAQIHGFHERPYLDQLTLIDLLLGLPERLLMRVDRACMRYGLEARVPFLDPAVTQLAFQIPQHLRAPTPKAFLKGYARQKLPAEILARPKVGFPTAHRVFLSPAVLARIRHDVLDNRFIELAGLDRSRLEDLFRLNGTAASRVFYQIWSVYVLSLWFHHWVERRP